MTFTYRHRKQIIIGLLLILLIASLSFYGYQSFGKKKKTSKEVTLSLQEKKKEDSQPKEKKEELLLFQVDIKGAVQAPGIYSVTEGSRVIDVIQKAGGLREDADTTVLNLSKKVYDEMVIIVYTQEEVVNFKATKEMEAFVNQKCEEGKGELQNDACIEENPQNLQKQMMI